MWLFYNKGSNGSSNWVTRSWPVNVSGNIGAMVSLSQINVFNDDNTAAIAYIAGYTIGTNPPALTAGHPSAIFLTGVTQLVFGVDLYGNLDAVVTLAVFKV
jgi:hypothetical protein